MPFAFFLFQTLGSVAIWISISLNEITEQKLGKIEKMPGILTKATKFLISFM